MELTLMGTQIANASLDEQAAIAAIQLHARQMLLALAELDDETLFDSDDIQRLRDTVTDLANGEGWDFSEVSDRINDCDFTYEMAAGK